MGVPHVLQAVQFEKEGTADVYDYLIKQGKSRIGVDMYVIMHWAFSRHPEFHQTLVTAPGIDVHDVYTDIKSELAILIQYGFSLLLVYDGRTSPFKKVEADRETKRQNAAARQQWANAFDIIPYQAWKVWNFLKDMPNTQQFVAPFEADPQLAYFYHKKIIDVVLTCDSDLIFYQVNDIVLRHCGTIKYYHRDITDNDSNYLNSIPFPKNMIFPMIIGNDYSKGVPNHGYVKCLPMIKNTTITICEHCQQIDWKGFFNSLLSQTKPTKILADKWQDYCFNEWNFIIGIYTAYPVFDTVEENKIIMTNLRDIDLFSNVPIKFNYDKNIIPEDKYELIAHCKIDPNTYLEYK